MKSPAHVASHRAHMPEGANAILNTRSLRSSYRRLAEILQPGLTVLDVGCGTGAITRGIAEAVAPSGRVVGIDVNPRLIEEARRTYSAVPGLSFEVGDVYRIPYREHFDAVTAARCLQWLAQPLEALRSMVAALKLGGRIAVLDYNHERIVWQPPPQSLRTFYNAFLQWRAAAGMDNAIADHLPDMFATVGLVDILETPQHEATYRGDADFETRMNLWAAVAASRGPQMVSDGFMSEAQRAAAEAEYRAWMQDTAESQTLYLISVEGTRPSTRRSS